MKPTVPTSVAAGVAILLVVGCGRQPVPSGPVPTPTPASPVAELPVSLNALMVGLVDHASDPLFAVGNAIRNEHPEKSPKTDADWLDVEYHAYQMIVSGRIMQIPGTGPMDRQWTADPRWKPMADALTDVGSQMLQKAQAKNPEGFAELGDSLVEACEGCHRAFKPELPTMRILHKSTFEATSK